MLYCIFVSFRDENKNKIKIKKIKIILGLFNGKIGSRLQIAIFLFVLSKFLILIFSFVDFN